MTPAGSYDELRSAISARHGELSRQLQKVARFALDNPNDMALETVAILARRAEVQPSTLIRFAKTFGFEGFTDMQRLFRERLVDGTPSYRERLRGSAEGAGGAETPFAILDHFAEAGVAALRHLREEIRPEALARAVELLAAADCVHVVGQRRSYPVAAYLGYALSHLDRRTAMIDGVGGMTIQQAAAIRAEDVLIAVSFRPYAPDTIETARLARERGAQVVAFTDGPLSPLAPLAAVAFEVEDAEVRGFRALSATMCLAVSLVMALGQRLAAAPKRRRAG